MGVPDLAGRLHLRRLVNATDLPNEPLMDATRHGAGLDRARLVEVSLLTVLSLFATVTTIFIFGTHINTWLSALSLTVAAR